MALTRETRAERAAILRSAFPRPVARRRTAATRRFDATLKREHDRECEIIKVGQEVGLAVWSSGSRAEEGEARPQDEVGCQQGRE